MFGRLLTEIGARVSPDIALAKAIQGENLSGVRSALRSGASPNAAINAAGGTALHLALNTGNVEIVRAMLNAGMGAQCRGA